MYFRPSTIGRTHNDPSHEQRPSWSGKLADRRMQWLKMSRAFSKPHETFSMVHAADFYAGFNLTKDRVIRLLDQGIKQQAKAEVSEPVPIPGLCIMH